jgi:hypothetical protein
MGVRQRDGSVLLDAAEAEYLTRVLASVRVARAPERFLDRHLTNDSYIADLRRRVLGGLVQFAEPTSYERMIVPGDRPAMTPDWRPDLCELDVQLAFVSGGLPTWPDRQGERELAIAWHRREYERGVRPGGPAFRLEQHQLRPDGFTTAAERHAQAAQAVTLKGADE